MKPKKAMQVCYAFLKDICKKMMECKKMVERSSMSYHEGQNTALN